MAVGILLIVGGAATDVTEPAGGAADSVRRSAGAKPGEEPMSQSVDLYGTAYGNFATQALEQVRRETYGEDFGQSSWVTGQEYRRFFRLLGLTASDHVLDVGCGSGGPALFLAREVGCRVMGVDGTDYGMVEEILFYPANDVYRVVSKRFGEVLFPVVDRFVSVVDIEKKKIIIDPPAGLFEEKTDTT